MKTAAPAAPSCAALILNHCSTRTGCLSFPWQNSGLSPSRGLLLGVSSYVGVYSILSQKGTCLPTSASINMRLVDTTHHNMESMDVPNILRVRQFLSLCFVDTFTSGLFKIFTAAACNGTARGSRFPHGASKAATNISSGDLAL